MPCTQRRILVILLLLGLCLQPFHAALAQQTAKPIEKPLTLEKTVEYALANYPAVRAFLERTVAAREGVTLAQTSYLPKAEALWQMNRATRNNTFGMLFPQAVVPAISGPVLATTSDQGSWGSAAGLLVSWEPFDFGSRRAGVDAARAREARSQAELSLTRLEVAAAVADAFLTLAAVQQQVQAAQADVQRRQVLSGVVHVLVKQELRAGADASRADAELAAARIQLIQATEAERIGEATLAQLLGSAGSRIEIDAVALAASLPSASLATTPLDNHPLAGVAKAHLSEIRSREKVFEKSYFPRFNVQAGLSGRGTGANTDGTFGTGADGLGPERRNWGVGLTATFSVMDFFSLRSRKQIELANERAQRAQVDQALQELTGRRDKANVSFESALLIAQQVPIQLQAAQLGETQARARYQAGLTTLVEVADAQRLLLRAEIDESLSKLRVWRSLLTVASAQGELEPFLHALRTSVGKEGR